MKSFLPKPILLSLFFLFFFSNLDAQNAWINEFHYDNDGGDEGEFVEIVIEDANSFDLALFNVHLYNGSDGESDGSYSLDTFTEGDNQNNFTIYYLEISGIQNGAPDGFSLDYDGTLIQFISYEGSFTAEDGPANGMVSEDVIVEETTSTPIGESLQLSGSGTAYSNFTWQSPASESKGQLNNGQTFGAACTAPTTQASFSVPTAEDIDDNQITLNWSSGDGEAAVILVKENSPVNDSPVNGTTYNADNDLSSGLADEIGTGIFVVYDGTATSTIIEGLTQGTQYHFAIFEYLNTEQCYLTASETISITTTTSFDDDSEISKPASQIPANSISSLANSEAEAMEVFKFDISDLGTSDGKSTYLQKIVIKKSEANDVEDWSAVIKGAKLNDGTSDLVTSNISIFQDYIEFTLTGNEFEIVDGSTESLILSIWLNDSQIDSDTIGFEISGNHGFEAEVSGSLLENPISEVVTSHPFSIEVEATHFEISTGSSAQVNEAFNLSATAVDAHGNTDLGERNISLSLNSGNGNLTSSTVGISNLAMSDGFYEWTDLEHDMEESIIIEVSDGNGITVSSPEIDIIPLINTVFFSEYIEGSSNNKAFEIFNNSGETIDLNDFSIARYTNGSESITSEYQLSEIQPVLLDQGSVVIAYSNADDEILNIADIIHSIAFFNGDDALALLYKGNVIDVIGEIGARPSNGWEVAGVAEATQDKTLVRKAAVTEGNPNNLASFGNNTFDAEWIVFEEDNFSFLGDHFRCESPTENVSNINIEDITENTAELNWNASEGLKSLVLIKEGNEVNTEPVSGTTYMANADFSAADELEGDNRIVFAGEGDTVEISNLNDGTTYHLAIYTYEDSCYNVDSPVTANFSTKISLDQDSEINDLVQPEVSSLLSTIDEESEAVDIFSFEICDLATQDSKPTLIEKMVFRSHHQNTLAWENALNVILEDENEKVNEAHVTVYKDRIEIEFPENQEYEIPSGQSVGFNLAIWFNRFEVSDSSQFALQIPAIHEFGSGSSSSKLISNIGDNIVSKQIGVIEVIDSIAVVRQGTKGSRFVVSGFISSNDYGVGNTQFYIQKDEGDTYENGVAVFSENEVLNLEIGNEVKISGIREEVNGITRINADYVTLLNHDSFIPETIPIEPNEFSAHSELIGIRVKIDSLCLIQPEFWGDFDANVLQFSNGIDSVLVKIQPNNNYYHGNAQVPLGPVDLSGVVDNPDGLVQLLVTSDLELYDAYAPVFTKEPSISRTKGESITLNFEVNELSGVYYVIKERGDSIPNLHSLKNPQTDKQIIESGQRKIDLPNVKENVNITVEGLVSNTKYSIFIMAEDSFGNATELHKLDFSTLNTDADHDIKVLAPEEQVKESTINAFEASKQFAPVFKFTVKDGGSSDGLSTFINQIVIHESDKDEANLSTLIKEVQLFDLSTEGVVHTQNLIFSDSIVIKLEEALEIADGNIKTLQLNIKLQDQVIDEQNLAFHIPAKNSSWLVEPNGSQLASEFEESIFSALHSINVEASELKNIYPAEVYVNENFNIILSAEDENGNRDVSDRTVTIEVEDDSAFLGQTQLALSGGQGVFEELKYLNAGEISLELSDGLISEEIQINFIKPELVVDTTSFDADFGLISYPEASEIQSYSLSAQNLKDSIFIVAPQGFQVSNNSDFKNATDSLILNHIGLHQTEIFIRFTPSDSSGTFYQGKIIHHSQDAAPLHLNVQGQEGTLKLTSIASVKDKPQGERVKIRGVVIGGNNHFKSRRIIQDQTAGVAIEGLNSSALIFGDSVEVEGILSKRGSWLKIIPEKEINILSSDSTVIYPLLSTINSLSGSVEYQRVKIEDLLIVGEGQFNTSVYKLRKGEDTISIKLNSANHPLVGIDIPYGKVNMTGFIHKRNNQFYLYPELEQDMEIIPRDTVLSLIVPEEGLKFESVDLDEFSTAKSYIVEAQNLAENLNIEASENFQISLLENSNYSHDLQLPINNRGDIPELKIYVRFSPVSARGGMIEGVITHLSGLQEQKLNVQGVETVITSDHDPLKDDILIYPNPVNSELRIRVKEVHPHSFQLVGLDGIVLRDGVLSDKDYVLNLKTLEKGIYFLKIFSRKRKQVFRIVKR
ncbi:lamin tail domain-containing protein [Marivirga harenae]|uniref:lamin tail domain-containing protein n=1 Tax=Marivirga harenae TaxID=2010992 RepID=UPI0026E0C8E4|nr:lamin tail domain-containing protein [Marivirga harenae]WKV11841.1 lamin tail domain-containing protein [Marivirga harenae]